MIQRQSKKVTVVIVLLLITGAAITAMKPVQKKWENLRILPQDISADSLSRIMDKYNSALNVHCSFCHQTGDASNNYKEDYGSDKKEKKQITRSMMEMTALINTQYFPYRKKDELVTCYTCHRGKAVPDMVSDKVID